MQEYESAKVPEVLVGLGHAGSCQATFADHHELRSHGCGRSRGSGLGRARDCRGVPDRFARLDGCHWLSYIVISRYLVRRPSGGLSRPHAGHGIFLNTWEI